MAIPAFGLSNQIEEYGAKKMKDNFLSTRHQFLLDLSGFGRLCHENRDNRVCQVLRAETIGCRQTDGRQNKTRANRTRTSRTIEFPRFDRKEKIVLAACAKILDLKF